MRISFCIKLWIWAFIVANLIFCYQLRRLDVHTRKKTTIHTHHFYFANFYSYILGVIALTVWCISRRSFVDKHNSLSYVIDRDVHDRGWTTRHRIMTVYKVFRINEWVEVLCVIGVNGKSCWSVEGCQLNWEETL